MKVTCIEVGDNFKDDDNKHRYFEIEVARSATIYDLKNELSNKIKDEKNEIKFFFRGQQLNNFWYISTNMDPSKDNLIFTRVNDSSNSNKYSYGDDSNECKEKIGFSVIGLESFANFSKEQKNAIDSLIKDVSDGLLAGMTPELSEEGSGGTYFMKDIYGKRVACFKPCDEEPGAANNPKRNFDEDNTNKYNNQNNNGGQDTKLKAQQQEWLPQQSPTSSMMEAAECRDGVKAGEAFQREVAAFLIDAKGYHSVPETIMVEISNPAFNYKPGQKMYSKKGSLQRYVSGDLCSDYSPFLFPVDEVHKIGILDLLLLNCDRNDGNLLVQRKQAGQIDDYSYCEDSGYNNDSSSIMDFQPSSSFPGEEINCSPFIRKKRSVSYCASGPSAANHYEYNLIPIDHGYCMSDRLQVSWCDLCWLDWPQTRQPFSKETKQWLDAYDVDKFIDQLRRELNIREPCLQLIRSSGNLLKKGVKANLCLHDIASIVVRQDMDVPSILETQMTRAIELSNNMLNNSRTRGFEKSAIHDFLNHQAQQSLENNFSSNFSPSLSTSKITHDRFHDDDIIYDEPPVLELPSKIVGKKNLSENPLNDSFVTPTVVNAAEIYTNDDDHDEDFEGFVLLNESKINLEYNYQTEHDNNIEAKKEVETIKSPRLARRSNSIFRATSGCDLVSLSKNMLSPMSLSMNDFASPSSYHSSSKESENEKLINTAFFEQVYNCNNNNVKQHNTVLLKAYFEEYLDRLLNDVIMCVKAHREIDDKSFFRSYNSHQLTSPHRNRSKVFEFSPLSFGATEEIKKNEISNPPDFPILQESKNIENEENEIKNEDDVTFKKNLNQVKTGIKCCKSNFENLVPLVNVQPKTSNNLMTTTPNISIFNKNRRKSKSKIKLFSSPGITIDKLH